MSRRTEACSTRAICASPKQMQSVLIDPRLYFQLRMFVTFSLDIFVKKISDISYSNYSILALTLPTSPPLFPRPHPPHPAPAPTADHCMAGPCGPSACARQAAGRSQLSPPSTPITPLCLGSPAARWGRRLWHPGAILCQGSGVGGGLLEAAWLPSLSPPQLHGMVRYDSGCRCTPSASKSYGPSLGKS